MKVKALSRFFFIVAILVALHPGGAVMAVVDLLYFIATPGNTSITLTWETATEFDTIGFYIQRGINSTGPFSRISPLIISLGDPLTGHLYDYVDTTVEIGVLYFYVLEVLNADSTSDLSIPVSAIIPAPTSTSTSTPTKTSTPAYSPSPTLTSPPTFPVFPVLTITTALYTSTSSPTSTETATSTTSPTTTLEPFSSNGINFPVWESTTTTPEAVVHATSVIEADPREDVDMAGKSAQIQPIVIITVILWITLAIFILFVVRYVSREKYNKL